MSKASFIPAVQFLLVPVILYYFLLSEQTPPAAKIAPILLLLLLGTRSLGLFWFKSEIKSFFDLLVDKIMIYGLLLFFFFQGQYWFGAVLALAIRDVIVIIIRWRGSRYDFHIPEEKYARWSMPAFYGFLVSIAVNQFFVHGYYLPGLAASFAAALLFALASLLLAGISAVHHISFYARALAARRTFLPAVKDRALIILANKKSSAYHDGYRRRLLHIFARRRKAALYCLPTTPDMFAGITVNSNNLIIAGGDGSFESALNHVPFHHKRLGFFPLGAGNAFYSYFYKGKQFEYLRSRFPFRKMKLDVLELDWDGKKRQTTFLCAGIDAEVIRLRPPGKLGFSGYLRSSWQALWKAKSNYSFQCLIDGRKYSFNRCVNLTLAKIPYYGFALRSLVGKVRHDNGKVYGLAVVNAHAAFWNKAVRLLGLVLAALNLAKPPLVPLQGREISVRSEQPFPLQAGGEFLGYAQEIKVRVVRKQKVLAV